MKLRINHYSFLMALLLLFPFCSVHAQKISNIGGFTPYWQINLSGGSSLFFGDIKQNKFWPATYNDHSEWRFGGGIMINRQFSPLFGLRGQALYGQLSGIKSNIDQYFESDYIEFNLNGTLNLNSLIWGYRPNRNLNVYLLAGVGLTNYNSTVYSLTSTTILAQVGNGYGKGLGRRTLEGILVGGVGIDYKINGSWNINLETASRGMNSDDMDPLVKNSKYDIYNYTSLGISYKFRQRKRTGMVGMEKPIPNSRFMPTPKLSRIKPPNKQTEKPQTTEMLPVQPPQAVHPVVPAEARKKAPEYLPQKRIKEPVRSILPVEPRLEYRVQIRAKYGGPISLVYLSKRFHLPQTRIRANIYNGYYIYTVGSYDTYLQARTERDILRSKNGTVGAFVVVFKNGRRLDKLP